MNPLVHYGAVFAAAGGVLIGIGWLIPTEWFWLLLGLGWLMFGPGVGIALLGLGRR